MPCHESIKLTKKRTPARLIVKRTIGKKIEKKRRKNAGEKKKGLATSRDHVPALWWLIFILFPGGKCPNMSVMMHDPNFGVTILQDNHSVPILAGVA